LALPIHERDRLVEELRVLQDTGVIPNLAGSQQQGNTVLGRTTLLRGNAIPQRARPGQVSRLHRGRVQLVGEVGRSDRELESPVKVPRTFVMDGKVG
jgi:hypothetical protein